MDDIKSNNPNNQTQDDYQEILDKYAASIKPEPQTVPSETPQPTVNPELETPQPTVNPEPEIPQPTIPADALKEVTPSPEPSLETTPLTQPTDIIPEAPASQPITPPEPETKTPEEIKAEIDRILTDEPSSDNQPKTTPLPSSSGSGKFVKFLFTISLVIFLAVAGGLAYFIFINKPVKNNISNDIIPTQAPKPSCVLNGVEYKLGDSFPSADGCNTCVCQAEDAISCTQRDCSTVNTTPSISPATQSATPTQEALPTLSQ